MADAQRPEDRLNTPGDRTGFHRRRRLRFNEESFGQFAEWIARFMGSPRFLLWMTVFVVSWIVLQGFMYDFTDQTIVSILRNPM